ncbi:hypothetical protein M422DRAFT_222936 [Sphaerobolus stellatus SS14]|nr:hypothetical protein M422DRAFT_222936 [Sphaerobolus stellatus SS14]
MAASPTAVNPFERPPSPPHLVSLVLQSKKALQHGEQLCSKAHELSQDSARQVVDVLALDAKLRWVKEGIIDQLKVAAGVAKSITERRERLEEEAKQWDRVRSQHQDALDATLESLGSQVVPPSFHQSSLASSLFGIQATGVDEDDGTPPANEREAIKTVSEDRSRWKTLRDFVDERGLEDVFESIEGERNALDETIAATAAHPITITSISDRIRYLLSTSLSGSSSHDTLPNAIPSRTTGSPRMKSSGEQPSINKVIGLLVSQEHFSEQMASLLESLAAHYEQMATALKENEAGQELEAEDMEVFIRDTAELPSIIAELEESVTSTESIHEEIVQAKQAHQASLSTLGQILDYLDDLGDKMEIMLQQQSDIELETQATYEALNDYLESLISLRGTFEAYQLSYNSLLLEMDRRRRYRDSIEALAEEMRQKLHQLREEEILARESFFGVHASSIPDDLCLAISNPPHTFTITSQFSSSHDDGEQEDGRAREVIPAIPEDLIVEAQRRLADVPKVPQRVQDALVTPVRSSPRREDSM